jgi:hypothetical protein
MVSSIACSQIRSDRSHSGNVLFLSLSSRQPAYPNPVLAKDHDRTAIEIGLQRIKIYKYQPCLCFRFSRRPVTKQNDRWLMLSSQGQQSSEVSVSRYEYTTFLSGRTEYHCILGRLQAHRAYMYGIVSRGSQPLRNAR